METWEKVRNAETSLRRRGVEYDLASMVEFIYRHGGSVTISAHPSARGSSVWVRLELGGYVREEGSLPVERRVWTLLVKIWEAILQDADENATEDQIDRMLVLS